MVRVHVLVRIYLAIRGPTRPSRHVQLLLSTARDLGRLLLPLRPKLLLVALEVRQRLLTAALH